MTAEIICIGDELLIGQTVNTNASWLGETLNKAGIRVTQVHTIADDQNAIEQTVKLTMQRSPIVIMTGGLGPTKDDITKHTLCEIFQSKLEINSDALDRIEKFMAMRNLPMLETNRLQAALPHNCRIIHNYKGTACGMWFEQDGHILVSMPGVPYEMHAMMSEEVIPSLLSVFTIPQIVHRTILTIGVGESFLAETIKDWEASLAENQIKLAYLPSPGSVKLRMSHYGEAQVDQARDLIHTKEQELHTLLGDIIYGYENDQIAEVVGALLKSRGFTLSVAESCTGGNIGHLITGVPGSSAYFKGGIVTYTNEIKTDILGVSPATIEEHNVVSTQVAIEMAQCIRNKFGTTFGLGITGLAGPDGGTPELPVGTVCIALSGPCGEFSSREILGRSRERTIQVASLFALNYLRKEILRTDAC
jgi:nicotinamide-nucleotide amidase